VKTRRVSVLQACVAAVGVHRGALAAAHVAQWALATHDLGHVPTTAEYADYWAVIERTGWNHRRRIRDALGDDWPAIVDELAHAIGEQRSPRAVMSMPVPRTVTA
jgi:hypothetical protein